jgi:Ca2+-binding EF-hand superfamily protein
LLLCSEATSTSVGELCSLLCSIFSINPRNDRVVGLTDPSTHVAYPLEVLSLRPGVFEGGQTYTVLTETVRDDYSEEEEKYEYDEYEHEHGGNGNGTWEDAASAVVVETSSGDVALTGNLANLSTSEPEPVMDYDHLDLPGEDTGYLSDNDKTNEDTDMGRVVRYKASHSHHGHGGRRQSHKKTRASDKKAARLADDAVSGYEGSASDMDNVQKRNASRAKPQAADGGVVAVVRQAKRVLFRARLLMEGQLEEQEFKNERVDLRELTSSFLEASPDGMLKEQQLAALLAQSALTQVLPGELFTAARGWALFAACDLNEDGLVDETEFAVAMGHLCMTDAVEHMHVCWDSADSDQDGHLSRDELFHLLDAWYTAWFKNDFAEASFPQISPAVLADLVVRTCFKESRMERYNDSTISFLEFKLWCNKAQVPAPSSFSSHRSPSHHHHRDRRSSGREQLKREQRQRHLASVTRRRKEALSVTGKNTNGWIDATREDDQDLARATQDYVVLRSDESEFDDSETRGDEEEEGLPAEEDTSAYGTGNEHGFYGSSSMTEESPSYYTEEEERLEYEGLQGDQHEQEGSVDEGETEISPYTHTHFIEDGERIEPPDIVLWSDDDDDLATLGHLKQQASLLTNAQSQASQRGVELHDFIRTSPTNVDKQAKRPPKRYGPTRTSPSPFHESSHEAKGWRPQSRRRAQQKTGL